MLVSFFRADPHQTIYNEVLLQVQLLLHDFVDILEVFLHFLHVSAMFNICEGLGLVWLIRLALFFLMTK